jgi:hydroxylamine reductase
MYCNQCEQTLNGVACTSVGVCGKQPDASALQDLLIHELRFLGEYATEGRRVGVVDDAVDRFSAEALFHTLTNVDFDAASLAALVRQAHQHVEELGAKVEAAGGTLRVRPKSGPPADDVELVALAERVGGFWDREASEDVQSVQQIVLYGLKGVAAYAYHAAVLGHEDPELYAFIHSALAARSDNTLGLTGWVALALQVGEWNLRALELLDAANTGTYGHPVPTPVTLGHRPNKAILVSGHDLKDLAALLEQTAGKGIDVYTHGEMLPAHGYPELKKHEHLVGHYGTAWQNQRKELAEFPGAVLFTTNCIQNPRESYAANVFTTGPVEFPGTVHVGYGEFGPVVERALELPGFVDDARETAGSVTVGFGHQAVLGVAPAVVEAVKNGDIRHFFLVGGCDGAKPGRSYYSDFVEKAPKDTVILTLACGKFRFFDKDLGDIGGIPRLLDIGQCNDAYSAVRIALALADAFECGVNDLPLSMVLSWYEQKAVAILLTLLHLGIKDIKLGPSLPAFITPNVLQVLVDNFGIAPVSATAEADLEAILG